MENEDKLPTNTCRRCTGIIFPYWIKNPNKTNKPQLFHGRNDTVTPRVCTGGGAEEIFPLLMFLYITLTDQATESCALQVRWSLFHSDTYRNKPVRVGRKMTPASGRGLLYY